MQRSDRDDRLNCLLTEHKTPEAERMEAAVDRVAERLQSEFDRVPTVRSFTSESSRVRNQRLVVSVLAVAAAVTVVAVLTGFRVGRDASRARYSVPAAGMVVRTDNTATQVVLSDGSLLEVRAHSELTVDHAPDGLTIRLGTGGVIVHAARQTTGRFYVRTNDATISVTGTVFLVNVDTGSSRVAVLEGEVHVRHGNSEKTLHAGDQTSTSPRADALPFATLVAWSPNAAEHLALLQQSVPQTPQSQQASVRSASGFEIAAIRLCSGAGRGLATVPPPVPGRITIGCATVVDLIKQAYVDFAPGRLNPQPKIPITGGPDWISAAAYEISATAPGNPSVAMMRGPMLQRLLEDRFALRIRRDARDGPAYALAVAPGGVKFSSPSLRIEPDRGGIEIFREGSCVASSPRPAAGLTPEYLEALRRRAAAQSREPAMMPDVPCGTLRVGPRGTNLRLFATQATFSQIAWLLGGVLDRPVLDRTSSAETVNAYLEFAPDGVLPQFVGMLPLTEPASAPAIFAALRQHLGLTLESVTAPQERLVIEHVERPSEN
jgi:uncharacterized protein (TIGR03435 family)